MYYINALKYKAQNGKSLWAFYRGRFMEIKPTVASFFGPFLLSILQMNLGISPQIIRGKSQPKCIVVKSLRVVSEFDGGLENSCDSIILSLRYNISEFSGGFLPSLPINRRVKEIE